MKAKQININKNDAHEINDAAEVKPEVHHSAREGHSIHITHHPKKSLLGRVKSKLSRRKSSEEKVVKQKVAKKPWISRRARKVLLFVFILIVIISGLVGYFIALPGITIKQAIDKISATAGDISQDLEQKDLTRLDERIGAIQTQMDIINQQIDKFDFLKTFKSTEGYYKNLKVLEKINSKTNEFLSVTIPKVEPILAAAGYKVKGSEATLPVASQPTVPPPAEPNQKDQQIQALIVQFPALLRLYEDSEPKILDILQDLNQLDPNYIPQIGKHNFAEDIRTAQIFTQDFSEFSEEIKAVFKVVPDLIGATKPANYLVIFQNGKEMRASGGLLTAYGNMYIDKGKLSDEITAKDMWLLNDDLVHRGIFPPIYSKNGQLTLMTYNSRCGGSQTRPQDSGVFPDQNETITRFLQYYDRAANDRILSKSYPKYDHVIILNEEFAASLISLVEPVEIPQDNVTITSANMALELTKHFSVEAAPGKVKGDTRKDFIKFLATAVKNKINEMSIKDLPRVLKIFLQNVEARNISFYSKNPDIQAYFDHMGMSGRIVGSQGFDGDYLMHSEAQYCALKSNFYVRDTVTVGVTINKDNSINKAVNVEWRNEAYSEDVPYYIINPGSQFPYAVWSRLVVPEGSKFLSSDGLQKSSFFGYRPKQYSDKDLGGYVLDHVILFRQVRHKGEDVKRQNYTTQYKLPNRLNFDPGKGYSILLIKHTGKNDEKYVVHLRKDDVDATQEVVLDRDKVVSWKDGVFTIDNYDHRLDKFTDMADKLQTFFNSKQ